MGDNGIAAYVKKVEGIEPNPAGELTCALSGNGVLSTFIQERPYYTGFHVACLRPRIELTKAQLLYYCVAIAANRYKYSWGRQANRTIRDIIIPSPDEIPLWVHQTDVEIRNDVAEPYHPNLLKLTQIKEWKWFKLESLFDIRKGKRLTKAGMSSGLTPFIGSIDSNNGYREYIGQEPNHKGNTITVNYNGSVAEAFFQPKPFWASDDVNVLYPKFEINSFTGMFFVTLIKLEKYRFNYGRKWHVDRMKNSALRLPVDSEGQPDFRFMEEYIKTLPFSKQI